MRTPMDTTIQAPDFSKLLKKNHINKWVAISRDNKRLLAVGDSLADILKKTDTKEITVMQVLPETGYAPVSR